MITGHPPFDGETDKDISESILNHEPTYPENISPELKDMIQKMLKKDPEERIQLKECFEHPWMIKHKNDKKIEKDYWIQQL